MGIPEHMDVGVADADLRGGAGFEATIAADGSATVDFTNMSPVIFTVRLADSKISGRFRYTGSASGTMATTFSTDATPFAGGLPGSAGRWRPVGTVRSNTRVALELDRPADTGTVDNMPLAGYPRAAVDDEPFFDSGRYWCWGDILTAEPDSTGDLPMILHRMSPAVATSMSDADRHHGGATRQAPSLVAGQVPEFPALRPHADARSIAGAPPGRPDRTTTGVSRVTIKRPAPR